MAESPAETVFTDDFSGTALDPTKWTIQIDTNPGGDPSKAHWRQDDSLQMMWDTPNTGYVRAISVPTFDTSYVDTYEVKTWQDGTSDPIDWAIQMITPVGLIGYFNNQGHWVAQWADSDGDNVYAFHLLGDDVVEAGTEYGMKIQVRGSRLEFYLDLADGPGYQLAHSTEDFSLPYTHLANGEPVAPGSHVVLSSSDVEWTYYDDLVVSRVIPAPSTLVGLLGMGIVGIIGYWWRRRKA